MKFKPVSLLAMILVVVSALSMITVAAGEEQQVKITTIITSGNTDLEHPGALLTDGDPGTFWAVKPGSGEGWVELSFNRLALIHGLELTGSLGYGNRLVIQYLQEDGYWGSFLAGSLRSIPENGIDLSYDRVVTWRLRLRVMGTSPEQVRLNELQVKAQPAETMLHRINPRSVEASGHTSFLTRAEFLTDGNTNTYWMVKPRYRSGQNWLFETIETYLGIPIDYNYNFNWLGRPSYSNYGEVLFDLGVAQTITNINIFFTKDARGDLTVEGESGGKWVKLGVINKPNQPGWQRLALNNPVASKIRLTVEASGHESVGGIGEVEFWGYGGYRGDEVLELGPENVPLTVAVNREFKLKKAAARDHRLDLAVENGSGENLVIELNGEEYALTKRWELNGQLIYSLNLTADMLDDETNYLRIKPQTGILSGLKLTRSGDGSQPHQTPALNDGLVLAAGSDAAQQIIELNQKTLVEQVEIFTGAGGPISLSYQNGNKWVAVNPITDTPGYVRYYTPFTTDRIKLSNPSEVDIKEVRVLGSTITDQAPVVRLLRPEDYEVFDCDQLSDKYLVGFVDNPQAKVKVNGKEVFQIGHYFGCHLTAIGAKTWEETKVEAVATDPEGRVGRDQTSILIDKLPWFRIDQPDTTVTTGNGTYRISGEVLKPNSVLKVNGRAVTDNTGRFATEVSLVEGLNLIKIECVYTKPGSKSFIQTIYRKVVRQTGEIRLQVNAPLDGSRIAATSIIVTGNVYGPGEPRVWVNGKAATVTGNRFSASVALVEGKNNIEVTAQSGGESVKASLTVWRDTVAPVLSITAPTDQLITKNAAVTVAGTVTDASPLYLLVNGAVVPVNDTQFNTILTLPEGWNQIIIRAQDEAGNSSEKILKVMVDTIAPAEFTPTADPSGWTNNNRPTISFATTDETSGVDHYEIRVGNGAWITPVVSPYRFSTAVPEGEQTVQVKAVDRAGNETIGEVKVYIDTVAPSAPADFEVISGIDRADLRWQDPKGEITAYRIKRSPAFLDGSYRVIEREEAESLDRYLDYEVLPGEKYTYSVQAIDRAGNYGAWTRKITVFVGGVAQNIDTKGGTFKFHDCEITMPNGAIGTSGKLYIFEMPEEMPENPYAVKVSPVYSLNLIGQNDEEIEAPFGEPVTLTIKYGDLQIPAGYGPEYLGIYWFNEMNGSWEKLPRVKNDLKNKTLTVKLKHFSEYQVMASKFASPDLESYNDLGVSPYLSYFKDNIEIVSTSSGSLTVSATDLKLPGRNGFDLIIKRIYDSTAARQESLIESNGDDEEYPVDKTRKAPFDSFGYGWSLNLPWIESNDYGKFLRLPEGQMVNLPEYMDSYSNNFEYHEGIHFEFCSEGTMVPKKGRHLGIFEYTTKRFVLEKYVLRFKDGTVYELNKDGKPIKKIDPSGQNEISYEYDGRKLTKITDSIGREIKFEYKENGKHTLIETITVNENSDVNRRVLRYEHDEAGKLISFTDPLGRVTAYEYDYYEKLENSSSSWTKEFNLYLLKTITYPTGESSTYSHVKYPIDISEEDDEYNTRYYKGFKMLVEEHEVAGKKTTYEYKMNKEYGSLWGYDFVPPYQYIESVKITEGDKTVRENYKIVIKDNRMRFDLVDINTLLKNGYHSLGALVVSREVRIDNDTKEVQRINYEYNVPLRAVTMEDHYRGGAWAYRITSSYDDWGNLTERNDGSRDLKETYTYYAHSRIKNLVGTKRVENKNPLTGQISKVTTTYKYDDTLGKPTEVTVEGGPETLITYYTYYDNGNLKSKTEPNGLVIEFEYDSEKDAFPVKKTVKGVPNEDGVVADIITEYGYNWGTGMKEWEKDPRGYTTHYKYDKLNRITRVILPDDDSDDENNPYREYQFDDDNNLCDFYNEKGQRTRFQFDGLGRLTEIIKYTDGKRYDEEVKTSYEYDALGRIVKVIDPLKRETKYDYDGLNRVVKVTYPDNNYVTLDYYDLTNSVTITDEEGGTVTERSDWANRLVEANQFYEYTNDSHTEKETYTWTFAYDSLGHKLRQIDPMLQQMDQEYDALGRLTKTILPAAAFVAPGKDTPQLIRPELTYEYDKMGNRTGKISANGNAIKSDKYKTSYEYDLLGRMTKVITKATEMVDGKSEVRTYITQHFYDAVGNRVKTIDPKGGKWIYTYSARGWLLSETDPDGNTTRYRYDVLGNKIAVTDPRGNGNDEKFTTWFVYDGLNRLYRTILPDNTPPADPYLNPEDNPYTEITYDLVGNKTKERDANGVTTSYEYTSRNWLWKVINGRGRVQKTYSYDGTGRVKNVTDINQKTVSNDYDSLGRLRKVIDPLLHEESYQYDKLGNRTAVTDGRGNTTYYSYNSLGWVTSIRQPLGNLCQYRYDLNGNLVETIAPNNLSTKAKYDELNRVVESIDSLGNSTLYRYDGVGNRSWMRDRRGTEWVYQYYANNLLQRVDASGADGTGYWVEYSYDEAGNRIAVKDAGNEIRYNFEDGAYLPDPLNRVNNINRSFDGVSYRTAYRYDKAGLVTGILYPEALSMVEYQYNKDLNQLTEVTGFTAPNGISYNDDGSLRGINYANGATAVYNYDANRRLDDMKVTVGGQELLNLDYTYDEVGNIKTVNDGGKLKTYEYDKNNQLIKAVTPGTFLETTPTPGTAALKTGDVLGNGVFEFTPILSGMMGLDYHSSSIGIDFGSVAPGVKVIELVPDQNHTTHRIKENTIALYVSSNNLNYTLIPRTDWEYQKNDKGVITLTLKEKLATRYLKLHVKYDERGRDFKPVNKATFLNEIAKMLRIYQEATARTEEYQYDAAGNRKLLKVTLVQTAEFESQYYTNSDRLKTDGKYAFTYDKAGNMVKKGNTFVISGDTVTFTKTSGEGVEYWEYQYDLLNRLIKVTKNGKIISEYAYDPEGFRVVKKAKGQTIHYVFQGTEPIFEKNITTGKVKSFVYALGKHLARVDGKIGDSDAKKYWYVTDHLGSIRAVTDKDGKKVWSADYLAFGKQYTKDGDFEELHSFTGKEYDPDTGLHYYNARWYDTDLGRFISEDSAGDPNNPNLYVYSRNNPLIFFDPTGQTSESAIKGPDQYASVSFYEKYSGYTLGVGAIDNDFTWNNTTRTNEANKGGFLMCTATGLSVYVSGTVVVSIFDDTMYVNADVEINPFATNGEMGLSLGGHAFVSISDDDGIMKDNGILGNKPIDSYSFPSFDLDFKSGPYDLSFGSSFNWSTSFTLPTEFTMDIQPDTITLNMGIYMGVYNMNGEMIVWPVTLIDNIVTIKFDEPGGMDFNYNKPDTRDSSSNSSDSGSDRESYVPDDSDIIGDPVGLPGEDDGLGYC